jgi:hypothetical protein
MPGVTRIDWTIQTGDQWWSGTNDTVKIEITRDGDLIKRLNLEPGDTPRLDRNEFATYFWVFQHPDGLGVSVSGTPVPFTVDFPNGLSGHLEVRFRAKGEDAWEALDIDSTVRTGRLRHIPGTIDATEWVEEFHDFRFPGRDVLSTDRSEGVTTLTLHY